MVVNGCHILFSRQNHLVGGESPSPLKNHGVRQSWDDEKWPQQPDIIPFQKRYTYTVLITRIICVYIYIDIDIYIWIYLYIYIFFIYRYKGIAALPIIPMLRWSMVLALPH